MAEEQASKYWLDQVVEEIIKKYPDGEIVVSSGISPSASYHIGHLPELLIVDVIAWALRQSGCKARHVHVVDNFDPLRKRYEFLPKEFEKYVGQPVCLIPDPAGDCHDSYAAHFYADFEKYAKILGVEAEVVLSYEDLYKAGEMDGQIEKVLENVEAVRQIFEKVSERKLPEDWTPVQIIGKDGVMRNGRVDTWDKAKKTIEDLPYTGGGAKLNWRLDWPARWQALGVMVEPFSAQEHGAAGGSHDTAVAFSKDIFKYEPPMPVAQYGNIHLPGESTKMSSSKGNLITPAQALAILPKELLRYFILKSRPEKSHIFDPGVGIYRLWEEYKEVEQAVAAKKDHEYERAYETANAHTKGRVTSDVPFDHLVSVYQAAQGDRKKIDELLERTGYNEPVKSQAKLIEQEIKYVKAWLDLYAPDSVKFSLQQALPEVELSKQQREFLKILAAQLEKAGDLDAQAMHEQIYSAKDEVKLEPKEAFQALYRVLFNQDSGPKAGWFLATLEGDWLVKRLKLEA